MRNLIAQYLFLSLITVGLGLFIIKALPNAIDMQLGMQAQQLENIRNGY